MASKRGDDGLLPRQSRFVHEYLLDLNATAAYQRSGYKATGNAAAVNAAKLLTNPQIAKAVEVAMAERSARTEITQDWVIHRLAEEAQRLDEHGAAGARVSALKLLGQHVGLFEQRPPIEVLLALLPVEVSGPLRDALVRHLATDGHGGGSGDLPDPADPANPST
jgi:phage terminase small subunit